MLGSSLGSDTGDLVLEEIYRLLRSVDSSSRRKQQKGGLTACHAGTQATFRGSRMALQVTRSYAGGWSVASREETGDINFA